MDEIIVLQTLYTLLVQNRTNRVSLVRLQTEINENALVHKLVPSTGKQVLSVHDILETIKRLFPKKTSLTDGQLTFYNLQLGEMRDTLFTLYERLKQELVERVKESEPAIDALIKDKTTSQRTRLLVLCRDTLLNKFEEHPRSKMYLESPGHAAGAVRERLDLELIRQRTPASILELQAWLQVCVANATMYHRSGTAEWRDARASQGELDETIGFVRSVLE
ncbi:Eaf5p [Lachancea thermotolerans CBS 6340]|uniref:KLTH0H14036p n=1 Tax=Lachancea thermotolerans (strain ATCC 56472 / CBS 6340 / NRRL Y-8284) TaxID=559295 RepID=C5E3J3_LACTC|nr:KLTH0H14036p [Lachancea thermotolerans CBS 6340]CAR30604.1 KLTH0H14036p [Lachancea thermotolerans CBS 6340]